MSMLMVQVRVMRMPMHQALVSVEVAVRLADRSIGPVAVLVVFIVHVPMLMLHRLMHMLVFVPFRQMKPKSDPHKDARAE